MPGSLVEKAKNKEKNHFLTDTNFRTPNKEKILTLQTNRIINKGSGITMALDLSAGQQKLKTTQQCFTN